MKITLINEIIHTMQSGRIVRYTRLLLAVIVALVLLGCLPATVKAQNDPVDLVLGGAGATSWNIGNVTPGDSGTEAVTLHNAGSQNGLVTIWRSDIVSTEGNNPESEAGNTAEPGELRDYLLFNVTCTNLATNLLLPTTIDGLPAAYASAGYLRVNPLNAGDTVTLNWQWELPAATGNDVQGDILSFTINYMLEELPPPALGLGGWFFPLGEGEPPPGTTDVRGSVSTEGVFLDSVNVTSEDEQCTLTIPEGTVGLTEDLEPLTEISMLIMDDPPPPPEGANVLGLIHDFQPSGATFEPPITLECHYDPGDIPAGIAEGDLVVAYYNEETGEWIELECTVDPETHTITATISHFTAFAKLSRIPMPGVAKIILGPLVISPAEVDVGEAVKIDISVINVGATAGTYQLTLKINDTVMETRNLILAAGQSEEVTLTVSMEVAGGYYVDINGVTGSFTVKPLIGPSQPQVEPLSPPSESVPPPSEPPAVPEEPAGQVTPPGVINWPIYSGIIGVLVVVGLLGYFLIRRRLHRQK